MSIAVNTAGNLMLSFIGANPPPPPPIYNKYYTDNGMAISNISLIKRASLSTQNLIINGAFLSPPITTDSFMH